MGLRLARQAMCCIPYIDFILIRMNVFCVAVCAATALNGL